MKKIIILISLFLFIVGCEEEKADIIDPCDPNPCTESNKTICNSVDKKAECSCIDGFTENDSKECIKDIVDPCDPNPCKESNKTICNSVNNKAECSCIDGFTENDSKECIKDIVDPCKDINCSNSGECIEKDGVAQCICNYTHLSWEKDCIERIEFFNRAKSQESEEMLQYFWKNYDGPIRNSENILFVTRSEESEVLKVAGTFNGWQMDILDTLFNETFRYKILENSNNDTIYYKYVGNDWYSDPNNIYFDFNEDENSIIYPLNSSRLAKIIVPSIELNNNDRIIYLYLPSLYFTSNERFPVLYMQDGDNILSNNPAATFGTWDVDINMDEAISENLSKPVIIVGITTRNREDEYMHIHLDELNNTPKLDEYTDYLIDTLIPHIDDNFRTLSNKESRAIAGSSLGGISSFFIAWKNPEIFSKAGVFSPSSWIGEIEESDPATIESIRDLINSTDTMPNIKFYIDSGDTNFDGTSSYYADSRGYTEYVRNLLVRNGWDSRDEWLDNGDIIDYPSNIDISLVPTIYWSDTTPSGYSDYYDYLKPQNNLLHLVGAGQMHNEPSWNKRFKASIIFLFPKN